MTLTIAVYIDLGILLFSIWSLLRWTERSVFNPGLWFVGLHGFVVTFRMMMVYLGSEILGAAGIRSDAEIVQAVLASDISLFAVTTASVWAAIRARGVSGRSEGSPEDTRLNPLLGRAIATFCLTLGCLSLLYWSSVVGVTQAGTADAVQSRIGDFATTSYPLALAGFAVQGAVILCVLRGFTPTRTGLLVILLLWSSVTLFRMSFVLPAILTILIHLTMNRKRTLSFRWLIGLLALGVMWYVGKQVAFAVRTGESAAELSTRLENYLGDSFNGGANDVQLLDLQAAFMAASDEQGKRFYGTTILPVIYLPIPRFMWTNKPAVNQFAVELSSATRAFSRNGMTPNLAGESYLNFGWWGCFFIPFLYMYGMQAAFLRVQYRGIGSAARWIYMVLLVIMVQVYRDGMTSLVLYPMVNFLPFFGWGVVSVLLPAFSDNAWRSAMGQRSMALGVRRHYR